MAQPTDFSLDPLASSGNTADGYLAIGWRDGKGGAYFYGGKEVMWMSHTYMLYCANRYSAKDRDSYNKHL